jgi:hypothetical protein
MMRQDREDVRNRLDRSDRRGMHLEKPVSLLRRYEVANAVICGRIARAVIRLQEVGNER